MIELSRRSVVLIVVGVVVLSVLVGGGWYWYGVQQARELAAYAEATTRLAAAQRPEATPEVRAAAIRDLEATLARYPSSSAAAAAAYELANLRYDAGDYAGARSAYEVVVARARSGSLRRLAQAAIGHTWEAQRDYAKAVEAYRTALSGLGPKDFYYEALLIDYARGLELTGKKAEAIETYRRLLKELPQARRADDVRARLLTLGAS